MQFRVEVLEHSRLIYFVEADNESEAQCIVEDGSVDPDRTKLLKWEVRDVEWIT